MLGLISATSHRPAPSSQDSRPVGRATEQLSTGHGRGPTGTVTWGADSLGGSLGRWCGHAASLGKAIPELLRRQVPSRSGLLWGDQCVPRC